MPFFVNPHYSHHLVFSSQTPLLQYYNSANSAFALINLGWTNAQKTCLFKIEIEKSDHQIRQAVAVVDQAKRLQQVAKEKALLEIEYMKKKKDAYLTVLNACQKTAT